MRQATSCVIAPDDHLPHSLKRMVGVCPASGKSGGAIAPPAPPSVPPLIIRPYDKIQYSGDKPKQLTDHMLSLQIVIKVVAIITERITNLFG